MKNTIKFLSLALIIIPLSACQTWDAFKSDLSNISVPKISPLSPFSSADNFTANGNCPVIEIVNELATLNTDTANANLSAGESSCTYKTGSVTVDLTLEFAASLNDSARDINTPSSTSYPFFVAVTAPGGRVLAKEVFETLVTFKAGSQHETRLETLRQVIPINSRAEGRDIKIITGFQLTKEQLTNNRNILAEEEAAKKAAEQAKAQAEKEAERLAKEKAKLPPQEIVIQRQATTAPTATRAGPIDITTP